MALIIPRINPWASWYSSDPSDATSLFTLFQDAGFRQVLRYTMFTRQVRRLNESFYLVCGLGDAGGLLVRELAERHIRCVVIEKKEEQLLALALEDLPVHVPGLCADALDSSVLLAALFWQ